MVEEQINPGKKELEIDMKWINFVCFIIIIILLCVTIYIFVDHLETIKTTKLEGVAEREGYYNCYCSSKLGIVTFAERERETYSFGLD